MAMVDTLIAAHLREDTSPSLQLPDREAMKAPRRVAFHVTGMLSDAR
jgi:hypothetical protein